MVTTKYLTTDTFFDVSVVFLCAKIREVCRMKKEGASIVIGSSENRVSYNGNGSATEFAFQFKILNQSDLKVLFVEKDGTERLLTKDYYVGVEKNVVIYPGYAPGAEIPESARPPVLPVGSKLVLYREVPITQNSRLDEYWPFNVIEAMVDKLTIICQQLADGLSRCIKLSVGTAKDIDGTIPVGANKTFKWDSTGKKLVLTEDPAVVLTVSKDVLNQSMMAKNEAINAKDEAVKYGQLAVESAGNAVQSEAAAEIALQEGKDILAQTTETAKYVNVFTPSVDAKGNISWTNKMGVTNPATRNIRGPQGPKGDTGPRGETGIQATTKGYHYFSVSDDGHLICTYDDRDTVPNFKVREDGHLVYEMEVPE